MKLQKGHNLALAEGKGRNGFEKTRHYVIFFSVSRAKSSNWHLF